MLTIDVLTGFKFIGEQMGLLEKLNELYAQYGYCLNTLQSYQFEGSAGFAKMQEIMQSFHKEVGRGPAVDSMGGLKIKQMNEQNSKKRERLISSEQNKF